MAHNLVSVRLKKPPAHRKCGESVELARILNDYRTAIEQYGVIVRYLKAAIQVLPKPDCQPLLEFAETAKNHYVRLHRMIKRRLQSLTAT